MEQFCRKQSILITGRDCRQCGSHFSIRWPDSNRQHCSEECARKSAQQSRKRFHKRNPEAQNVYNRRRKNPDNKLARLRRRWPELPNSCQSCGEARVLEVAHRPQFAMNGSWSSKMENRKPHMIWILCPTCHKLIDKKICTPEELHLS